MATSPYIRLLDPTLINQIAAGEVIERPAAAVKELVENSVDAGATNISIVLREGGRTLIQVTDNGCGMGKEDMVLAVERHATSKLPDGDLFNIQSFGFRGEALPSIGAVSRLTITSRPSPLSNDTTNNEDDCGHELLIEGGTKHQPRIAAHPVGTTICVRDLFYATPARLKFLKSVSTEVSHCTDNLKRLAMAHPNVSFSLKDGDRKIFHYPACESLPDCENLQERIEQVLGSDFMQNARPFEGARGTEGASAEAPSTPITIKGFVSIPTYNRSQSGDQYLFVNGRPVRDKLFQTAVRIAYQDLLANNRYPVVVAYLTIDPAEVDVNVHPAKTEVRFRDAQAVRSLIIGAIRQTLINHGGRTSTHLGDSLFEPKAKSNPTDTTSGATDGFISPSYQPQILRFEAPKIQETMAPEESTTAESSILYLNRHASFATNFARQSHHQQGSYQSATHQGGSYAQSIYKDQATNYPTQGHSNHSWSNDYSTQNNSSDSPLNKTTETPPYLGKVIGQIHSTFILAEKEDSLIIVDQHAAHERLVYERLKKILPQDSTPQGPNTSQQPGNIPRNLPGQLVLLPEFVNVSEHELEILKPHLQNLQNLGFDIQIFGEDSPTPSVVIRQIPALLKGINAKHFINDLISDIKEMGQEITTTDKICEILSSAACHGSIRAGRKLKEIEMDALLRQMEETPLSGQCNHGRPTYIEIKKTALEKMFGRS